MKMFLRSCSLAVRWSCSSARLQTLLRKSIAIRSISTSRSARKDEAENAPAEKLDLDIWKSVMKSQALHEEEKKMDEDPAPTQSVLDAHRDLVDMWHQAGKLVPKNITDEQLQELVKLGTKTAMKKYLKFLATKEACKNSKKRKQEMKAAEREANPDPEDRKCVEEQNTFLMRGITSSMERFQNWRAAQAMSFGQPLVLDMSYEQHMSRQELENTVSQLLELEGWNRRRSDPFHLHYCNLQPDGAYHRELLKRYGSDFWERMFITATARQHVDIFPHRDLVYLTADSRNVLHTFDQSKVYIVGAMVDRSIQTGVSLANAKRLQLATARLPLDEYLDWEMGAKNLTLDQMIRILGTVKETGSWQKALEFVPKRKHKGLSSNSDTFARTEKRNYIRKEAPFRNIKTNRHKKY